MKNASLSLLLSLFLLASANAKSTKEPQFKNSPAYRALTESERTSLLTTYNDLVEKTVDEYLAKIPAPHTEEQGRAVEGMARCVADATIVEFLRSREKTSGTDDAKAAIKASVESCGKRVAAKYQTDNWSAMPKLDVVNLILDFDSYRGKTVAVRGRLLQRGELTFLYQSGKANPSVIVETSALSRDERKRILLDCAAGCSIQIVGVATEVMALKGLKAAALR